MGANLVFGKSNGVADSLQAVEFKRVDTHMLTYFLDHGCIFAAGAVTIGFKVAYHAAFQFLDTAAGDEFHVGF